MQALSKIRTSSLHLFQSLADLLQSGFELFSSDQILNLQHVNLEHDLGVAPRSQWFELIQIIASIIQIATAVRQSKVARLPLDHICNISPVQPPSQLDQSSKRFESLLKFEHTSQVRCKALQNLQRPREGAVLGEFVCHTTSGPHSIILRAVWYVDCIRELVVAIRNVRLTSTGISSGIAWQDSTYRSCPGLRLGTMWLLA